jgi:hypothetical protein
MNIVHRGLARLFSVDAVQMCNILLCTHHTRRYAQDLRGDARMSRAPQMRDEKASLQASPFGEPYA